MDPVSVVGLIGSIISIADVVAKSIRKLSDLRTKARNAPMQLTTLIGQLYIIKAVIEELERWRSNEATDSSRYHQLALQVEQSLECFCPMILSLEQYLVSLEALSMHSSEQPGLHEKLSYLWNENDIATYMGLVDRQVNALNLFLQAVQCSTWAEQQRKMQEKDSQDVLQLARDCTSSILPLCDQISFISENTNGLSVQFDFDSIVLGSKVYQTAHRSHVKQIIRSDRPNPSATPRGYSQGEQANAKPEQHLLLADSDFNEQGGINVSSAATSSFATQKPQTKTSLPGYANYTGDEDNRVEVETISDTATQLVSFSKAKHARPSNQPVEEPQYTVQLSNRNNDKPLWSAGTRSSDVRVAELSNGATGPWLASQDSSVSVDSKETALDRLRSTTLATFRDALRRRQRLNNDAQKHSAEEGALKQASDQKILLLGTSESGKSTVLKMLQLALGHVYKKEELKCFQGIIFSNVIQSTRVVLEAMDSLEMLIGDQRNECYVATIFNEPEIAGGNALRPEVVKAINILWQDASFLECYRRRHEYQLNTSSAAFAKDIFRLGGSNYQVSDQDILRYRVKTLGITETEFKIGLDSRRLIVYDVGGVRVERKKWLHVLEKASSIIFTVDATCYCKLLSEDESTNRMQEALKLFDSIANSQGLQTNILLVFTHLDQLDEVIRISPVKLYFEDFFADPGRPEYLKLYLDYLERRFRAVVEDVNKRQKLRVISADLIEGDRHELAHTILDAIGVTSVMN